jgi:hypothetical protein
MDDENAGTQQPVGREECRPPTRKDLVALCGELNRRNAKYVVVGGFAVIASGFPRLTTDLDLMVAAGADNEAKVLAALATLPDNAVRELQPSGCTRGNRRSRPVSALCPGNLT